MLADRLAAHPFFAGLGGDALSALATMGELVRYPAGWWIAREGQHADRFYAVVHGRAMIEAARPVGDPVVVSTVHTGEVIGWSWLFWPHRWHFDVIAVDDVEAIALRAEDLREMLDHEPLVGNLLVRRLAHVMAERLAATRLQLLDISGGHRA